jgi:PAS domain S-box-containing protein
VAPPRRSGRLPLAGLLVLLLGVAGGLAWFSPVAGEGVFFPWVVVALGFALLVDRTIRRMERDCLAAEAARREAQVQLARQSAQLESDIARRTGELSRALLFNQRLALVASRTTNSVVITNPAGEIEWVNEGFTRISGYTFEDAVGRRPGALLRCPETDPETVALMRARLTRGEGFDVVLLNRARDGRRYWMALEVQPLRDPSGRLIGFTGIGSDITARRQAEENLRAAKEEAEQLNAQLEHAIAQAQLSATEANIANQAKSAFLATMSHEIRTPLNGILGMAGLLKETPLDESQRELIRTVETSGDALLTIINDILDYSKIEAGRIDLEMAPFDLRQCFEDALDLFAARAAEKGLELFCRTDPSVPAAVVGDVTRLRQIVVNLVGNALKFTAAGEVEVTLDVIELDGRPALHGAVRDTGIGIPAERLSRLFRPFSQIDSTTTRKYGGTGLGLAISARLAEAMGGRMWVESEPGRGSTFHFTIVAAEEPLPVRPAWLAAPAAFAGRVVLVGVPNDSLRAYLAAQLAGWGAVPTTAANAGEMQAALENRGPWDAVILDPRLRCSRWPSSAPVVELDHPGHETNGVPLAGRAKKPIKPGQLFAILQRVLGSAGPSTVRETLRTAPPVIASDGLRQCSLLLVEDNPVNQRVAIMLLARLGFAPRIANNGEEAVAEFGREPTEVVLMDIEMPVMDGYEATQRIRGLVGVAQPWIIALTANAMHSDKTRARAAGMNDFLTKPIRPAELREALAAARSLAPTVTGARPATHAPFPKRGEALVMGTKKPPGNSRRRE